MTEAELDAELDKLGWNHPYVSFDHDGDEVCLDGHFTLPQLELIITYMKALNDQYTIRVTWIHGGTYYDLDHFDHLSKAISACDEWEKNPLVRKVEVFRETTTSKLVAKREFRC